VNHTHCVIKPAQAKPLSLSSDWANERLKPSTSERLATYVLLRGRRGPFAYVNGYYIVVDHDDHTGRPSYVAQPLFLVATPSQLFFPDTLPHGPALVRCPALVPCGNPFAALLPLYSSTRAGPRTLPSRFLSRIGASLAVRVCFAYFCFSGLGRAGGRRGAPVSVYVGCSVGKAEVAIVTHAASCSHVHSCLSVWFTCNAMVVLFQYSTNRKLVS
jgi:hypothetical protein